MKPGDYDTAHYGPWTVTQVDIDLLNASMNGDLKGVRNALANGAQIEVREIVEEEYSWLDFDGTEFRARRSALDMAAANGHLPVVRHLVKAGAAVQCSFPFLHGTETTLAQAVIHGQRAVVEFLLEKEANPGRSLEEAIERGEVEILELLLDHGMECRIGSGRNPYYQESLLGVAIGSARPGVVRFLADRGQDLHADLSKVEIQYELPRTGPMNYLEFAAYEYTRSSYKPRALEVVTVLLEMGARLTKRRKPRRMIKNNPALRELFTEHGYRFRG